MQTRMWFVVIPLLAAWSAAAIQAQITSNPIPAPIVKRGLAVEIRDLVRLPDTRGIRPADQDVSPAGWARVSYVRDLPDGRRFANDSRGFLYLIGANNQPQVYANVAAAFPHAVYNRLESGFIGFVFHPEFARNGLFYTVHAERGAGQSEDARLHPARLRAEGRDLPQHHHRVARDQPGGRTCSRARDASCFAKPTSSRTSRIRWARWSSTRRRSPAIRTTACSTPAAAITASATAADRTRTTASQTQRLDSIMTAILRFDPRSPSVTGGVKGLGDYTIPMANKFAADGDPKTLGEIYAYGFRNAHRLSWDTDGTMFASDIGMNHIEEINIVRNGENYGWMKREGYWENGRWRGGALERAVPASRRRAERAREGRLHLSRRDLRPRRGAGGHRRVRVSRPDRRAARQVRLRRHSERPPVRGRSRRDEEGRRRDSADRGADRGNPALRARRQRQSDGRLDAGARRSNDGREHRRAPICTSAEPATASCSSRRGRTG